MASVNDGGPAFPSSVNIESHPGDYVSVQHYTGASLRDYFAAKAMAAYIPTIQNEEDAMLLVRVAYKTADAMLKERSRTDGE